MYGRKKKEQLAEYERLQNTTVRETGYENQRKGYNCYGTWSHGFSYACMDYWTEKLLE
jgi:hypothetical protein